jgi:hypothetical protein
VPFVVVAGIMIAFGPRARRKAWLAALCCALVASIPIGWFLYRIYLNEELFGAAQHGDAVKVEQLLSAGADPNFKFDGATSVLEAAKDSPKTQATFRKAGARG